MDDTDEPVIIYSAGLVCMSECTAVDDAKTVVRVLRLQ